MLSNAVSLDMAHAPSYYELGKVLLAKGELDLSIDKFNKSLELSPEKPEYLIGLTSALIEKKELDKALKMLLDISDKNPKNPELLHALCNVYTTKVLLLLQSGTVKMRWS